MLFRRGTALVEFNNSSSAAAAGHGLEESSFGPAVLSGSARQTKYE
jgi:hypothetical protein